MDFAIPPPVLEIRTRVELESKYRVIFYQDVWRADRTSPLVASRIDLVAVNQEQKLVQLPESVLSGMGTLEGAP